MIQRNQSRISQDFVAPGNHAMRVTPHAKTILGAKLRHGRLEALHAVCVVFQKQYGGSIHGLRFRRNVSPGFVSVTQLADSRIEDINSSSFGPTERNSVDMSFTFMIILDAIQESEP